MKGLEGPAERKWLKIREGISPDYDMLARFLFRQQVLCNAKIGGANMNTTTLNALAETNRLHMVELLRDGPLTVGEIADRLQVRQPQVSKHLKVLNEAEIVEVHPEANRRIYKLRPEPLQELDSWLDTFRSMWEDRLDRLEN